MSEQTFVNLMWADALLCGLESAGVRDVVISPGSRNTPLILAADRRPKLQCHVQVDERCAAFFALGISRRAKKPVALLCTSGSAPANWHPAVVEADRCGVPLILLSVDRPWELQQRGANQTIDQMNLFAGAVRAFHALPPAEASSDGREKLVSLGIQAIHQSLWPNPGPVHINVPFREPLVPAVLPESIIDCREKAPKPYPPMLVPDRQQLESIAKMVTGSSGIIVVGDGLFSDEFRHQVGKLAEFCGAPIFADPLSSLRFGSHELTHVIADYDLLLEDESFADTYVPSWVIRFGAMPVSRNLQRYLKGCRDAMHILVDPSGQWSDPLHQLNEVVRASPEAFCETLSGYASVPAPAEWLAGFVGMERAQRTGFDSAVEAGVIRHLIEQMPDGSTLFSGNSLPIRHLDRLSGKGQKQIQMVANRGVSGIDGNISTILGMATVANRSGQVVAGLIGDLTLYHDMNGLLAADGVDAVIVILNNRGGGIFKHLPQANLQEFERYWKTPTGLDIGKVASLYGLGFQRVSDASEFSEALSAAMERPGVDLIEVVVD